MRYQFSWTIGSGLPELRLIGPEGALSVDRWAVEPPDALLPGVDRVRQLEAHDLAIAEDDVVLVEHRAIAALSPREATQLGLPPLADAFVRIAAQGLVNKPGFHVFLEWLNTLGQPILGAERTGAFLRFGREQRRISETLFEISEAVDAVNRAQDGDMGDRFAALATLRDVIPAGAQAGLADATGLVGRMTIAVADAFSLDLADDGDGANLVPILHRAQGDPDAPLLPAEQQRIFGDQQFNGFTDARSVYTLGDTWYVVLQPLLRRALSEVRRVNGSSRATKRAFMANPRAFLREALGDEVDEIVLDSVFRETASYADRVIGLGLWAPRVVPWIKLASMDWFGGPDEGPRARPIPIPRVQGGIEIDGRRIELDSGQVETLRREVETAMEAGRGTVDWLVSDETLVVPATPVMLASLTALQNALAGTGSKKDPKPAPIVLLIRPNEETVDVEALVQSGRAALSSFPPSTLATPLKAHQAEGLAWLQSAWTKGLPGVLLADDMGLGKTLQSLAFMAWLREGMQAGVVARAPLIVVAPTGLLQNWRAEHDRHLTAPGLGTCTEAYGRGLAQLKRLSADGRPSLDVDRLARSDWVLTTYETLRDYDRDFGQIRFAALLFDEAQKIKTPGIRLTDAAKAMQAEFQIAMTGTPVENRLSDLWCIIDTVQPGCLGDLKGFSARYERELEPDGLRTLKATLERSIGGRPQIMLRRMKEDRLPDLPGLHETIQAKPMPPLQREAYEAAVAKARSVREPGAVLNALHDLRGISLHPDPEGITSDDAYVAASARLQCTIAVLDEIAELGERALIFLGDLGMQARLAGLIQRRYGLPAPPLLINGTVSGSVRQARVDEFQETPHGFGAMILSPRAGGAGLTLSRANHVIHLSRWWNPAVEDQCTGRAQRIGQTRPVYVHIPMAVLGGGTRSFDENLADLLARKRKLMRETLLPSEATASSDRDELFKATVGEGVPPAPGAGQ